MNNKQSEWQIDIAYASRNQFSKFQKKHPGEYSSLFANLNKLKKVLEAGHKIGSFKIGFFRSEGEGVYRVGQTGSSSAKESRLYIFPDEQNRVIYPLNIGDKDSQKRDINEAQEAARRIKPSLNQ